MIMDLLMCKCEESGCEYEFVSTTMDYLDCPACGSENIEGVWKKAAVFENISYDAIRKNKSLTEKIECEVNSIEDTINAAIKMRAILIDWFRVNKYKQPDEVKLEFETSFDNTDDGEECFSGIVFEGSENVNSYKLEELCDNFSYLFSMNEKLSNRIIKLN